MFDPKNPFDGDKAGTILAFDRVMVSGDAHHSPLDDVSFALQRGELVAVLDSASSRGRTLFDAAQGLLSPKAGTIAFLGWKWDDLRADLASEWRGRIGRYFTQGGWISNLEVDENVLFPSLYHSARPAEALRASAEVLARRFGLEELPSIRLSSASAELLHRAQLVRVFLAEPDLVLLEAPEAGPAGIGPSLFAEVKRARARGAAILWWTRSRDRWKELSKHADTLYRMEDSGRLVPEHGLGDPEASQPHEPYPSQGSPGEAR